MLEFGLPGGLHGLQCLFFTIDSNEVHSTRLRYCYEKQIIKSTGSDLVSDLMMQEVTIKVALLMRTRLANVKIVERALIIRLYEFEINQRSGSIPCYARIVSAFC